MSETKFTPEWIDGQKRLIRNMDGASNWRDVTGKYIYFCRYDEDDNHDDVEAAIVYSDFTRDYLVAAANNYPDALDEIERLRQSVSVLNDALTECSREFDNLTDALGNIVLASSLDKAHEIARAALDAPFGK